jgi:hypothetical protein
MSVLIRSGSSSVITSPSRCPFFGDRPARREGSAAIRFMTPNVAGRT